MSSPQVESPAGDSLSHNDLIAEVEKTARSQVDEERKSAVQHLHQLLKEIADQAIANGDDEGVLELWQAKWMENFKDSSQTNDAFERFRTEGELVMLLQNLQRHREKMTRRSTLSKKVSKLKKEFEPKQVFATSETSWRFAIQSRLTTFGEAVKKVRVQAASWVTYKPESSRHQAALVILDTWVDDVKRSMISYFLRSNDKVVSGMQIVCEISRLILLVESGKPRLLSVRAVHGRAEPYLTPCYGSEQILERVEAWNVNPSNSLSKRLIGRRIAEIEGVAHFKNANGETCF